MTNIFQGQLVRLRAVEPSDGAVFRRWVQQDTDSGRLMNTIEFPIPVQEAQPAPANEAKSHQGDDFPFEIETLDGVLVGAIHTQHCNLRCGTFMYGIGLFPEHRGKGYAAEAILLTLRYYFYERRYQKCNVEVFSFNPPSQRLHERLGFVLEGRLRRTVFADGQFHDCLMYGITREEFDEQHRAFLST